MELKDKVAVITGATRGLGRALAESLRDEGMKVVASGRDGKELWSLEEAGFSTHAADVRLKSDMSGLADFALEKHGRLDIWVNNAGVWVPHPLVPVADVTIDDTKEMMDVNLYGLMNGSLAALARMREGGGAIVNVISTSGIEGRSGSAGYCASKFAANGYALSMRAELEAANDPVKILNVYPGGIKTALFRERQPESYGSFMEPAHVAAAIVSNLKQHEPAQNLVIRRPELGGVSTF